MYDNSAEKQKNKNVPFDRIKYAELKKAMLEKNLTDSDLAKLLGLRKNKLDRILNEYGKDFTVYQAFIIRDFYFGEYELERLFAW